MPTKTWLYPALDDVELFIANLSSHRSDRKVVHFISKHGGCFIGLKLFFISEEVHLRTNIPGETDACSSKYNDQNILVVCFYNPPSPFYRKPKEFEEIFEEILNIANTYNAIHFQEVLNIADADWYICTSQVFESQKLFDLIPEKGKQQLIDIPTGA